MGDMFSMASPLSLAGNSPLPDENNRTPHVEEELMNDFQGSDPMDAELPTPDLTPGEEIQGAAFGEGRSPFSPPVEGGIGSPFSVAGSTPGYSPLATGGNDRSPSYSPLSPSYSPAQADARKDAPSPTYQGLSPTYSPRSPAYTPSGDTFGERSSGMKTPSYTFSHTAATASSPAYAPSKRSKTEISFGTRKSPAWSPTYSPTDPSGQTASPSAALTSPMYTPLSPQYTPASPAYTQTTPVYSAPVSRHGRAGDPGRSPMADRELAAGDPIVQESASYHGAGIIASPSYTPHAAPGSVKAAAALDRDGPSVTSIEAKSAIFEASDDEEEKVRIPPVRTTARHAPGSARAPGRGAGRGSRFPQYTPTSPAPLTGDSAADLD